MSSADATLDRPEAEGRRAPDLALTGGVYVAIFAAIFPLFRVVTPGLWTLGLLILPALLLAAGYLARRRRLAAVGVSLIEALLWALVVTVVFLRGSAFLGFVPTPATIGAASDLVQRAVNQIVNGAAPLDPGMPLTFLIVASIGLLTIGIDHVVLTARMPLLAAIGLIVVSLIPAIAVPDEVDVLAFVLLAAALLFLLRADTRVRETARRPAARAGAVARRGGVAAAATGIGAIAVIVALVAGPLFPATSTAGGVGGRWNSIDPTLRLGSDLRRPVEAEVLRMQTDATTPPYLRAATLSSFDGWLWRPDTGKSEPLASEGQLDGVTVKEGIRLTRYTTKVDVTNLVSGWLPVAYPAVKVSGLEGEWGVLAQNRTLLSTSASANGQHYEIVSEVPRPTLEQVRAASAQTQEQDRVTRSIPTGTPPIIGDLAEEVTADADNDYDKLVALQSWFRSSEFKYSLEAPVEDEFDGTGVQAVAKFLRARSGYCIHFASAFALMARSLDMSTRIVVGYLPGQGSTDAISRVKVYTVMSSQLHAWPEVYFSGIGWIPFEPTNSLGTPTSFSPASSADEPTGGTEVDPSPSAAPTVTPSASALPNGLRGEDTPTDASSADLARPLPWLGSLLALLLVLAAPAAVREFRRRDLQRAAEAGGAVAAWRSLQDTVIDLAIAEPAGESPRVFGARLVAEHGAPADATAVLVAGIEQASYAPDAGRRYMRDLGEALTAVRAGMMDAAGRPRRLMALLAPRSLIIRPGSAYALDGARARAR